MNIHVLRVAALATLVACAAACSRAPTRRARAIHLRTPAQVPLTSSTSAFLARRLDALAGAGNSPKQWSEILHVSVKGEGIQVVGGYQVVDDTIRFTPTFPFDPGRTYDVWLDTSRLPGASVVQSIPRIGTSISLPRPDVAPSTVVTHVYPSW